MILDDRKPRCRPIEAPSSDRVETHRPGDRDDEPPSLHRVFADDRRSLPLGEPFRGLQYHPVGILPVIVPGQRAGRFLLVDRRNSRQNKVPPLVVLVAPASRMPSLAIAHEAAR